MKRLLISTFAALALLAAATTFLWSHSAGRPVGTVGMSLQDLHKTVNVNRLPIEEFEDQSWVYSAPPKQ